MPGQCSERMNPSHPAPNPPRPKYKGPANEVSKLHSINARVRDFASAAPMSGDTPSTLAARDYEARLAVGQPQGRNGRCVKVQPKGSLQCLQLGLDVHFNRSSRGVLDENGKELRQRQIRAYGRRCWRAIGKIKEPFHVCYEASLGYGHRTIRWRSSRTSGSVRWRTKTICGRSIAARTRTTRWIAGIPAGMDQVPQVHVPGRNKCGTGVAGSNGGRGSWVAHREACCVVSRR